MHTYARTHGHAGTPFLGNDGCNQGIDDDEDGGDGGERAG